LKWDVREVFPVPIFIIVGQAGEGLPDWMVNRVRLRRFRNVIRKFKLRP
jgi:hypothetical protein